MIKDCIKIEWLVHITNLAMDNVVNGAFWGAIEKRRQSEKHVLKTVVAMPKVLHRIILDYSRIDMYCICEILDSYPRTKVSHLKITDNDTKLSMTTFQFCVNGSFYSAYGCYFRVPFHYKFCEIMMPHVAITIINNTIINDKINKETIGLTINTMIKYIETGEIVDDDFQFTDIGTDFPRDVLIAITPMVKFLFDHYIWQNVQTPANMRVS